MLSRWCAACTSPSPSSRPMRTPAEYAERHRLEAERLNDMEMRNRIARRADRRRRRAADLVVPEVLWRNAQGRAIRHGRGARTRARARALGRRPEPIGVGSAAGPRSLAPLVGVDVRRPLQAARRHPLNTAPPDCRESRSRPSSSAATTRTGTRRRCRPPAATGPCSPGSRCRAWSAA